MNRTIALSLLLSLGLSAGAQQNDKLLATLKHELKANFDELGKQPVKPYYMSYRASDVYKNIISSSFGVIQSSNENRQRTVTPQIRLGDKTFDNFKYNSQGLASRDGRSATTNSIPFDDSATEGISTNIWSATKTRYDYALAAYEQAKSKQATSAADEDKAPGFSDITTEHYYEHPIDLAGLRLDTKAWEARLNAVSAVFREDPSLVQGNVTLDYEVVRTYFVNTDGAEVVQNRVASRIMLGVEAIAEDGMSLPLNADFFSFSVDSLPSEATLVAAARDLLVRVEALRKAPVANPYTGPAILSGPASGVFFHEIFGHRLEGHRLKEGGETFKNMVGKQVLPTSFQVACDPTLRRYAGTDLTGYYLYDSEGVRARRVENVTDGVLREFLMSRVPLDGFPQSNGHGRASGANDPVSRQSNLVVETKVPNTEAQLRKMLITEAKKQGKDYGYYFKTVTSGYTMTGQGGSINSFNVMPVEVYRIYVDGREDELVRGVSLIGTPLSMFSHIEAGGDTPAVFTGQCGAESGWVPVTASSPAIYVSQIETQRVQRSGNVPPILAAPAFTKPTATSDDDIVIAAMRDEMKRTKDSLRIDGATAPFWVSYGVNRTKDFSITGEYGGISRSSVSPWSYSTVSHVLLGNFKRTSDVPGQPMMIGAGASQQLDYSMLRRTFWSSSDQAYKSSVMMQAQKDNYLLQNPLSPALEKIPDMQHSPAITMITQGEEDQIDQAKLENMARELSAIFKEYKHLENATVEISGSQIDSYRATTEDVILKQPHSRILLTAKVQFVDDLRVRMGDDFQLSFERFSEIPSLDELKQQIRAFADRCMTIRNAEYVPEYYKGPVMFEDKAAMQVFTANYLLPNNFYAQPSIQENPKSLGEKLDKKIMDERITITNETALKDYNGQTVYGHYNVDADGFEPAATTTIVENGVFKTMLNRATPAMYAPKSTGSARWGNSPRAAVPTLGVGTLHIKATGTTGEDKMVKELIKRAKKQKLAYAYIITLPDNSTCLRLDQIDVKTGERKPMKTNVMVLPNNDQMKKLVAISDKENIHNETSAYSYSVVYPSSLIVDDMELNKSTLRPGKVTALTYPLQRN